MKKREVEAPWKALEGRTIVKVKPNAFQTGRTKGDWTCDPVLILDDGTAWLIVVDETEVGEYGVRAIRSHPPSKRSRSRAE